MKLKSSGHLRTVRIADVIHSDLLDPPPQMIAHQRRRSDLGKRSYLSISVRWRKRWYRYCSQRNYAIPSDEATCFEYERLGFVLLGEAVHLIRPIHFTAHRFSLQKLSVLKSFAQDNYLQFSLCNHLFSQASLRPWVLYEIMGLDFFHFMNLGIARTLPELAFRNFRNRT